MRCFDGELRTQKFSEEEQKTPTFIMTLMSSVCEKLGSSTGDSPSQQKRRSV
jgi:hypothetical protein